MNEDITTEVIQQIVDNTISSYTQSLDFWLPILSVIVSIGILTFAIFTSARNQKIQNRSQLQSQKQFIQTQNENKNLLFIERLEYFQTQLLDIRKEFKKSSQNYNDCRNYAKVWLTILNRIAFLYKKELIDSRFIDFFEYEFNAGRTALKWLNITEPGPTTWDHMVPHFHSVKHKIEYSIPHVLGTSPFYYYAHKSHADPNYDPKKDKSDPRHYTPTSQDVDLIKPENPTNK